MAEQPTNEAAQPPQEEVRSQRPRAAPPQPVLPESPNAWQRNRPGWAWLCLTLNLALFVVACLLFSALTADRYLPRPLSLAAYRAPLGECMLEPQISIYQVPMQGLVVGLLLAVFVSVPVLIAQFYGRWFAILFLVALALLAQLPLLAAAMIGATWLARARLFGVVNRFLRGLISLAFPVAALWVSTSRTELIAKGPTEQILLHLPWIAAIVMSMLTMLLFWVAAWMVHYRAGLGALATALLTGAAGIAFFEGVGLDELRFRRLDADYGYNSLCFKDGPADQVIPLADAQRDVASACRKFLRDFPDSRYVPYVLFLLARSQDMNTVRQDGSVCFYDDLPSDSGQESWKRLLADHPDHPLSVLARLQLGCKALARGDLVAGAQLLGQAYAHSGQKPRAAKSPALLAPRLRDPQTHHIVMPRLKPLRAWLRLLETSDLWTETDVELVAKLFALDRRQADYASQLERLRGAYARSSLAGYLDLRIALHRGEPQQQADALSRLRKAAEPGSFLYYEITADLANLLARQTDPPGLRPARLELASELWMELRQSKQPLFVEEADQGLEGLGYPATQPD